MLFADNPNLSGEFVMKLTSRRLFRGDLRDRSLWCDFGNHNLRMTRGAWDAQMEADLPQVVLDHHVSSNIGVRTTILLMLWFNAQHITDNTLLWRDGWQLWLLALTITVCHAPAVHYMHGVFCINISIAMGQYAMWLL